MVTKDWARRDVVRGVAAAALAWTLPLAVAGGTSAAGPDSTVTRDREARRRWALARMDEIARDRLRCHDKFRTPREIRNCQEELERRYRAYNDIYLEALRE
jgi:hypothetical protein